MSDGEDKTGENAASRRELPDGGTGTPGPYNGNGTAIPVSAAHVTLPSSSGAPSIADAIATAYRDLYDKLATAWHSVEIRQAIAEADYELQQKLAALSSPGQTLERCELVADYLRTVRTLGTPERQQAKIAFAYSRYLDEVKVIWSRHDIHDIDPRQLSAFGESIAWAGYYASLRP
jgi:hypothetical protein